MLSAYTDAVAIIFLLALFGWGISLVQKNVNAVDTIWSLFFFSGAVVVMGNASAVSPQSLLVFVLITIWSIRLSAFLTVRNWGKPEDRRYQAFRKKYSPYFEFRSLLIVYLLQAMIASVIFIGVIPGLFLHAPLGWLDLVGVLFAASGIIIEAVADWQLYRFKKNESSETAVLNNGLWALSRHPNYFGEFLFWWGLFIVIFSPSYLWVIISPVIMTLLLLKVSGVSLMEKSITHHKPEYEQYIRTTPVFFPRINLFAKDKQQHGETA